MKMFIVISRGLTAADALPIVASSDTRVIEAALSEIARVGRVAIRGRSMSARQRGRDIHGSIYSHSSAADVGDSAADVGGRPHADQRRARRSAE